MREASHISRRLRRDDSFLGMRLYIQSTFFGSGPTRAKAPLGRLLWHARQSRRFGQWPLPFHLQKRCPLNYSLPMIVSPHITVPAWLLNRFGSPLNTPAAARSPLLPLELEFDILQFSDTPFSGGSLDSPCSSPDSAQSSLSKFSTLSLGSPQEHYQTMTSVSALSQDDMFSDSDSDWDPVVDGLFDEDFDEEDLYYEPAMFSDEDVDKISVDDPEPPPMLDQEFVFRGWDSESVRQVICPNPRYPAPRNAGSLMDSLNGRPLSPILEIRGLEDMTGEALERDIAEEAILRRDQWELQCAGCGVAWVDPIEVTVEVRVTPVTPLCTSGNIDRTSQRPRVFFSPREVRVMQDTQVASKASMRD
ncbi:hypothetical protein B0H21DRAFT_143479 [Amylocystis lapponica]|nr:hypothetical protein B0H21DRAFT_143479 [Amylocystis lapponica]